MQGYYEHEVWIVVEQMAERIQRPARPAAIHKETGEVIPHENGIYVDIDATVLKVMQAPAGCRAESRNSGDYPTHCVLNISKGSIQSWATSSTPLMGGPDRVHNIRLSLAAINNTLVMPGEVFSFNGVVGERTKREGYHNAPIILGEQ